MYGSITHLTQRRTQAGEYCPNKQRAEGQGRIPIVPGINEIAGHVPSRPDDGLAVDEHSVVVLVLEGLELGAKRGV